MGGLRSIEKSGVWHYEELEYHRLDLAVWYNKVCEKGLGFMVAWVMEEEKAPENRQRRSERGRKGGQGWGSTWGDRRKVATFQTRFDWTNPKTPGAASAAPIGKPENPESMVRTMICLWCKCEVVVFRGALDGSRRVIYLPPL